MMIQNLFSKNEELKVARLEKKHEELIIINKLLVQHAEQRDDNELHKMFGGF